MRKLRGWKMTQRHKCLLYKPQDAHQKSSAGAPALTLVLRRRQDHLWSLTAAILANWQVPDAMKDTHLKVQGENDWEDQMSTPSLCIHMYTHMEKEVGEDEEWTEHVQVRRHACAGQTKAFRIGSLLPPRRTEDQIQVVNSAASALPHSHLTSPIFAQF